MHVPTPCAIPEAQTMVTVCSLHSNTPTLLMYLTSVTVLTTVCFIDSQCLKIEKARTLAEVVMLNALHYLTSITFPIEKIRPVRLFYFL